ERNEGARRGGIACCQSGSGRSNRFSGGSIGRSGKGTGCCRCRESSQEAGSAEGAANQAAAREFPCPGKAAAGSSGYVQPELSDSRKRSVAGSAIRSIPLVSSGTARSGLVSVAFRSRGADRWRLLLLQQRLLVSGMGLQSFGTVLFLRCYDICGSSC